MSLFPHELNVRLDFTFFWPLISFLCSVAVSYLCYPVIIRVSKLKKLMPKPNHRSVHKQRTPNLGGIGIFIAINLIITFLGNYFQDSTLLVLLGAITILFFTGLIDDLIGLKPKEKILCQLIAAISIILLTDLRIANLYGLFGIEELPYSISFAATVLFYIFMINAYNLIDGVDGLAGSYAIAVSVFFGLFYYANGNASMFFLCICIVGALISFLMFNLSKKEKVFMGDTGSLVVGFLLAYQAINFLSVDFNPSFLIKSSKSPIFIAALFSFPVLDTFRVFFLRIINKKNPFTADKNHIHHVLLSRGLKHWKIAFVVSFFTMAMVSGVFIFNELDINKQAMLLLGFWAGTIMIVNNLNLSNKLKIKDDFDSSDQNTELSSAKQSKVKTIYLKDMA